MGRVGDGDILLEKGSEEKDMDSLLTMFMKHSNAKSSEPPKNDGRKKNVDISIVHKEKDRDGKEHLKTEVIKYKVDLSNVAKVKNIDRPGAQLVALKKTLKDKIFEKKRVERDQKKVCDIFLKFGANKDPFHLRERALMVSDFRG